MNLKKGYLEVHLPIQQSSVVIQKCKKGTQEVFKLVPFAKVRSPQDNHVEDPCGSRKVGRFAKEFGNEVVDECDGVYEDGSCAMQESEEEERGDVVKEDASAYACLLLAVVTDG